MMTIRPISTLPCECENPNCDSHAGHCGLKATDIVYSAYATDGDVGVVMCDECADQAIASGRYTQEDVAS